MKSICAISYSMCLICPLFLFRLFRLVSSHGHYLIHSDILLVLDSLWCQILLDVLKEHIKLSHGFINAIFLHLKRKKMLSTFGITFRHNLIREGSFDGVTLLLLAFNCCKTYLFIWALYAGKLKRILARKVIPL